MPKMPLKVLIITAVLFLLGYLSFLGYSIFTFAPERVDFFFRRGWVGDNALLLFCRNFLTLHTTGVLLAFSLFFKTSRSGDGPEPFYKMVRLSLVLFLFMAGTGFTLQELAAPGAEARQIDRAQKTTLARQYQADATELERQGRYAQALDALRKTIALIPGEQRNLKDRMDTLSNRISDIPEDQGGDEPFLSLQGLSARQLLLQAQVFEDEGDLFSAYYYSDLSFRVDPALGEARAMASRIWDKLGRLVPEREDQVRWELFNLKKRGTELLSRGKPVDAYYTFLEARDYLVQRDLPEDKDISTYLSLSRMEVLQMAFFPADTEAAQVTPGYENLLFLNTERTRPEKAPVREYIAFRRLIPDQPEKGSWMAEGVAVTGISAEGVVYEITAPFGKILPSPEGTGDSSFSLQGRLILNGINPESRGEILHPAQIKTGSPPEFLEGVLPLSLTSYQLRSLAMDSRGPETQSFYILWQNRKTLPPMGISPASLDREILTRILYPFTLFIAAILAATVGWRHRQRNGRPVAATVLLLAALPFLMRLMEDIYFTIQTSFLGFTLYSMGFTAALIVSLILQAVLFTLSFIFLAFQHNR